MCNEKTGGLVLVLKAVRRLGCYGVDYQRMFVISWLQIFRHEAIDADGVPIDGFVGSAVNMEGGELLWIQYCR